MKTSNFVLYFVYISSIYFIKDTLGLETEGIYNGDIADYNDYKFHTAIFGIELGGNSVNHLGSGALVSESFVLSAAHLIVDVTERETYQLKPYSFYVTLGAHIIRSQEGQTIYVENFYVLGYNATTGRDDLILIDLGRITPMVRLGPEPWKTIFVAIPTDDFRRHEMTVAGFGIHSTEINRDYRMRWSTANVADNRDCDNISRNHGQICVKMQNARGLRKGLCKYDGGAPLASRDGLILMAIASKPKRICDDTVRGSIYTDVRSHEPTIDAIIHPRDLPLNHGPVVPATAILQNNPPSSVQIRFPSRRL